MDQRLFPFAVERHEPAGAGSLENETARRGEHAAVGGTLALGAPYLALSNRVPRDERAANAGERGPKRRRLRCRICQCSGSADAQVRGQWRRGERGSCVNV